MIWIFFTHFVNLFTCHLHWPAVWKALKHTFFDNNPTYHPQVLQSTDQIRSCDGCCTDLSPPSIPQMGSKYLERASPHLWYSGWDTCLRGPEIDPLHRQVFQHRNFFPQYSWRFLKNDTPNDAIWCIICFIFNTLCHYKNIPESHRYCPGRSFPSSSAQFFQPWVYTDK